MDPIKTLERLFKLEQSLSALEDKFQERDKWCAALEFWLIKKFAYDFQSSSAEFEVAKEKERRRRNKDFYAEEDEDEEQQQEFSDEASRTEMNSSPIQYSVLADKSSDGFSGNLIIDDPSTLLPPCSQIKAKSQNTGFQIQNNHLPTWGTHVEAQDEMGDMEIVTNQEDEVYSADSTVDSGQDSQGHISSRFPVSPKEERVDVEEQGEETNEFVGTFDNHFNSERPSESERMLSNPDLSRTRDDDISNLARVQSQQQQSSENLFLSGSKEVQKSPSTLSNCSIIKIEAESSVSQPKLRCKRCKKLFHTISEVDHHMTTFHMPPSKKKKVEPAILVQCQHCNKTLSSNYVHRHENKCSLRPIKSTTTVSTVRSKGPSLVFSLPQEESRNPEDLKTDSYIRPIVRPEGYACETTTSTGILDKSCCDNNFNTTPAPPLSAGENMLSNSVMMNGSKRRENGEENNMLRFSCKVCQVTFSNLRECRLHIVTEHLQEVLKTPLPVASQPNTNRIDMELKGDNLKKDVPTLAELLNRSKVTVSTPCRPGTGVSMVQQQQQQQQQKLNSQTIQEPGSSVQQQAFPSSDPTTAATTITTGLTSTGGIGTAQLKSNSSNLASAFQPVVKNSTSSLDHSNLLQSRLIDTGSNGSDNNIGNESHSNNLSLPYPCLHCKNQNLSNSFEYLQDLHMHVLRCHVKKVNYQCPLCSQEFSQQAFAEHIVTFHRQGTPMPDSFSNLTFGVGGVSQPDVKLNPPNLNPPTPSAAPEVSEASNSSSTHSSQKSIFEDNFPNPALGREDQVFSGDANEFRVQCGECSEFMSFSQAKSHASMHTYFAK